MFASLRFCSLILLAIAVCPVVANADFVIDDFASPTPNGATVSIDPGTDFTVNRIEGTGYQVSTAATTAQSGSITYSIIGGLYNKLFDGTNSNGDVFFEVPFWRSGIDNEGTFTVTASFIEGGTTTAISPSTMLTSTLDNQTEFYTLNTPRTVGDLLTTDITGIRFDIDYTGSAGVGNIQTLHFGGTGNGASNGTLTAVPEPTSLLLFGSVLAGVTFRRRRK